MPRRLKTFRRPSLEPCGGSSPEGAGAVRPPPWPRGWSRLPTPGARCRRLPDPPRRCNRGRAAPVAGIYWESGCFAAGAKCNLGNELRCESALAAQLAEHPGRIAMTRVRFRVPAFVIAPLVPVARGKIVLTRTCQLRAPFAARTCGSVGAKAGSHPVDQGSTPAGSPFA